MKSIPLNPPVAEKVMEVLNIQAPGPLHRTLFIPAKAISLYFLFLLFNEFAQAEDEWILEEKEEHLGIEPPGNRLCIFS